MVGKAQMEVTDEVSTESGSDRACIDYKRSDWEIMTRSLPLSVLTPLTARRTLSPHSLANCYFQGVSNISLSSRIWQDIDAIVTRGRKLTRPILGTVRQLIRQSGRIEIETNLTARGQMNRHRLARASFQQVVMAHASMY